MAAAPVVASGTGFNWKSLIPILTTAGNIVETFFAPEFLPLTTAIENAVLPAINAIGTGQNVNQTILAAYAALIGVLNALQVNTKLDPATLAKVKDYVIAANDGLNGYMAAMNGFDPTIYGPVTLIP